MLLSGMGADELFGGYRKHLACVMAARYQKAPQVLAHTALERGVDALPVTAAGTWPAVRPMGQEVPDVRRASRRRGVPPQLHPL